jgi:hypothetical protein
MKRRPQPNGRSCDHRVRDDATDFRQSADLGGGEPEEKCANLRTWSWRGSDSAFPDFEVQNHVLRVADDSPPTSLAAAISTHGPLGIKPAAMIPSKSQS